jgi:uncharacterized protein YjcR
VNKRLPAEGFAYYLSLGADRGYAAVVEHYGVSKRTVTAAASREKWQERVAQAEARVRDEAQQLRCRTSATRCAR